MSWIPTIVIVLVLTGMFKFGSDKPSNRRRYK